MESGLDVTIFNMVLDKGDLGARLALARDLSGLAANAQAPESERRAVQPVLARLAADPVREVRAELARRLASAPMLSDDVVFSIIADAPEIAAPFLAQAVSLDGERMMAVMKVGDAGRQLVLAARPDLPQALAALMAAQAPESVVLVLLANASVKLPGEDAKIICRRFPDSEPVAEALLQREDLPAVVRALLSARAAGRLAEGLEAQSLMPVNRAREVLLQAQEMSLVEVACAARPEEWTELASFLTQRGEMTASLLLRLAARGEAGFVAAALAHLGRISPKASPARLVRAAGLPEMAGAILVQALALAKHGEAAGEGFCLKLIERIALANQTDSLKAQALLLLGEAGDETIRKVAGDLAERFSPPLAA